jgi:hypothetical protein
MVTSSDDLGGSQVKPAQVPAKIQLKRELKLDPTTPELEGMLSNQTTSELSLLGYQRPGSQLPYTIRYRIDGDKDSRREMVIIELNEE